VCGGGVSETTNPLALLALALLALALLLTMFGDGVVGVPGIIIGERGGDETTTLPSKV
jgi:hypothetical protein